MPTRLLVLLQRRKSALAAGAPSAKTAVSTLAAATTPHSRARAPCCGSPIPNLALVCRYLIPVRIIDGSHTISISRERLRTVNEDSPEVVHVGQCRSWRHQIAKFLKEFGRIVVGKKDGR